MKRALLRVYTMEKMTKYIVTELFHSEVDDFSFYIILFFYFLRKRGEREREHRNTSKVGGGAGRKRERESPKQAPHPAWSPKQGSMP